MKTLIAEDDFTCRTILQGFLQEYGLAHIAVNGREAIQATEVALEQGEPYDLICLDVKMPEMDGQAALKEIRRQEEARGILSSKGAKILMTTALGDLDNILAAFGSLCDAYLIKPVHKDKLRNELRNLRLVA